MAIEKIQLSDALLQNPSVVEEIVGIPHGFDTDSIATDGVFIMFHNKSSNLPLIVKLNKWISYQNSGEIADGVAIVEGNKILIVAPTEGSLYWSSATVNGEGTTTNNRIAALDDWNGKNNTGSQITHAQCSSENYAPGFCSKYSRVNSNGQGLTAGKWWLPSLGELMMIYANMNNINYALSLVNGAKPLVESAYWSSTEYNETYAWILDPYYGYVSFYQKIDKKYNIRPISAFIQ